MGDVRRIGLDLWRALAIMLVLVGHASFFFLPLTDNLGFWYGLAFLGVELFFVLSGFLIGGILIDEMRGGRFHLGRFWARRWLRTLPNYYLFLALNIVMYHALYGVWPQFGLFVVFLQNFAWPHPPMFSEAWSLSTEEWFYVIAPLAVLAVAKLQFGRGGVVRWLLVAVALVTVLRVGYVMWRDPVWDAGVRKIAVLRLDTFVYGILAVWFANVRGMSARARNVSAALGLAGVLAAALLYAGLPRDHDLFARTLLFNLVPASLAAMLPLAAQWRAHGLPPMLCVAVRRIALWSYSLYLCQLLVMRGMSLLPWQARTPVQCAWAVLVFMVASIGFAALVYRGFELPILRWRDRVTARGPLIAPNPSP